MIPDRRTPLLSMQHEAATIRKSQKRHVRSSEMSSHLKPRLLFEVPSRNSNQHTQFKITHCTQVRWWEMVPDRRTPRLSTQHNAVTFGNTTKRHVRSSEMSSHPKIHSNSSSQSLFSDMVIPTAAITTHPTASVPCNPIRSPSNHAPTRAATAGSRLTRMP